MNTICYKFGLYKIPEKMALWVAWKMPHWLVNWCLIRAWAHATQGEYENDLVGEVTMDQVIRRWENK